MACQPVQRAVVSVTVDAPQPLIGQVGQPRRPPVAQRPGQGEDDLGGAGGVGGDHLGPDAGLVGQQPVEHVQAVALGTGDQLLGEDGVGVGHPRVQRGATLPAEVARVVGGVDGGHGDDEPHPVGGGHLPAAPGLGQRQGRVVVDQPGVRGGVGGRAQVVMPDPVQPLPGQRRVGRVGDRGQADVA